MNETTDAEHHPAGASIGDLTFLIAEDHEFQRSALKWMLTGLGATTIHEAADGPAALAIQSSIIIASALDPKLVASIATMAESYGIRVLGTIEKPLTPDKLSRLIQLHGTAPHDGRSNGPTFTLDELVHGLANDEFEP